MIAARPFDLPAVGPGRTVVLVDGVNMVDVKPDTVTTTY